MGRRSAITAHVDALHRVYRDHHRTVRWLLLARGVSGDAIDDATQDVFLAIHRRLPTRDVDVPMAAWVAGIACNTAFTHRRARARRAARERVGLVPTPAPDPEQQLGEREAWAALDGFLRSLLPEQRTAFVMADVLGMTVPEIASSTAVPLNTLYSRLRLARARFAAHFDGRDDARATLLEQARAHVEPTPTAARQTWALLLLALPHRVSSAAAVASIGALAVAGALGVAVSQDRVPDEPNRRAPTTRTTELSASSGPPDAALLPAASHRAATPADPLASDGLRPVASRTHPAAMPASASDDGLARAVAVLDAATMRLRADDPQGALIELERHRTWLARTPLAYDAAALERKAACALAQPERAREALVRMVGTAADAVEDPCAP